MEKKTKIASNEGAEPCLDRQCVDVKFILVSLSIYFPLCGVAEKEKKEKMRRSKKKSQRKE